MMPACLTKPSYSAENTCQVWGERAVSRKETLPSAAVTYSPGVTKNVARAQTRMMAEMIT